MGSSGGHSTSPCTEPALPTCIYVCSAANAEQRLTCAFPHAEWIFRPGDLALPNIRDNFELTPKLATCGCWAASSCPRSWSVAGRPPTCDRSRGRHWRWRARRPSRIMYELKLLLSPHTPRPLFWLACTSLRSHTLPLLRARSTRSAPVRLRGHRAAFCHTPPLPPSCRCCCCATPASTRHRRT